MAEQTRTAPITNWEAGTAVCCAQRQAPSDKPPGSDIMLLPAAKVNDAAEPAGNVTDEPPFAPAAATKLPDSAGNALRTPPATGVDAEAATATGVAPVT